MPRLRVTNTDIDVVARAGETILATMYRAGYAYRVGCRRGGCGICKVDLKEGIVEYPVTVSEQALSTAERAAGVVLSCRAVPAQDVTVEVPPEGKLHCVAPLLTQIALGQSAPGSAT